MFLTIKSESKYLNFNFKVPMKLITINLKLSIAMICYNKPASRVVTLERFNMSLIIYSLVLYNRVSQIGGVFQKIIFESCTLFHLMPFAKIINPIEKNMTKS